MFALHVALRYLFSKKSHNAVNVISIVSMIGVAVATAAIVCVLSVFNGFTELTASRLSRVDPDLRVVPVKGKYIGNADSLASALVRVEGVGAAVPAVDDQALAMYSNRQMPVRLIGLDERHADIVDISRLIIDGAYIPAVPEQGYAPAAALSVGVASRLGVTPMSEKFFAIYAPRRIGSINPANPMAAFVSDSLVVSGVYEVQETDFDGNTVIVPLSVARRLFDYSNEASEIYVSVLPGADMDRTLRLVSDAAGAGVKVLTRLEQQEASFRMIAVEKWITFSMLAFILVIASFNIVSTLSMLIIEKNANIATFRAMGATVGTIRRIFMLEGWLVTLVGGVAGTILGVVLVLAQQWGGFIRLGADPSQLTITAYPVRLMMSDIVIVFCLVAVVGWLVGWLTSRFMIRK